jgi:oligopeptide transport system permease protein
MLVLAGKELYLKKAPSALLLGIIILALLTLSALLVPYYSPYSYDQTNLACKNLGPHRLHLFGTDDLGRDLLTRTAVGLRLSLVIALCSALIDVLIGLSWGISCALFGGWYDHCMMQLADFIYSLPYLLVVIFIATIFGPGFFPIICAMILLGWIQMARMVRFQVLEIKNRSFITAAVALGIKPFYICCRHILPNISGPILATLMLSIPYAIFVEAFLSFLGIGIQPPRASLGAMVSDGVGALRYYPWRLFFPAAIISLTILAFNLLGDGIRDALDPQNRAAQSS